MSSPGRPRGRCGSANCPYLVEGSEGVCDRCHALLNRALPKWPQMRVAGEPVTVDQAKEIIRRTDNYFLWSGGNDHDWVNAVNRALLMPPLWWASEKRDQDEKARIELLRVEWEYRERWRQRWDYLHTEYVNNEWLSSCYIGGPHGWIHPNGLIGYVDNVGKWPSCGDIFEEWKLIAATWPFLKLGVTLMSGESCEDETKPIISFAVADGKVEVVDPAERDVLAAWPQLAPRVLEDDVNWMISTVARQREHGVPPQWIEEWAVMAEKLMGDDYRKTFK